MNSLRLFIDTHHSDQGTFPEGMTEGQFLQFYPKYEEACRSLGAVSARVHLNFAQGRAFCVTWAKDEETVRKAHEIVGLAYDSITEVVTAAPDNVLMPRAC